MNINIPREKLLTASSSDAKKKLYDFNLLEKIWHGKALPCFAAVPLQKLPVPGSPVLLLCVSPRVLLLHLDLWANSNKTGWVISPQPVPSCLKEVTSQDRKSVV